MLLEREAELDSLRGVIQAARSGEGGIAIVEGEGGIGKTALLDATSDVAHAAGTQVLRARGGELEQEFGFGVVRQLLERIALKAPGEITRGLFSGAAALAKPVLGLAPERNDGAGAETALAAQHGLYWLVCNLAEATPVLVVVDDAHWADVPSLEWIVYLGRRLEGVPIGVIVAWRSGEPATPVALLEALREAGGAKTLAPSPLSEAAVASLVRAGLSGDPEPQFCEVCHDVTGGNPFLIGALVDALKGGVIPPTAEAARRVQQLGPAAVSRYVLLRLAGLPTEATALARAVAVLDTDAQPEFAAAVAGLDLATASAAATALERARILKVDDAWKFAHPIMRAAVYADLPAAERAAAHRRAARALKGRGGDPDRAAIHVLASEPAGDVAVVEELRAAADRALQRGAAESALALLERALAEPPPVTQRPGTLLAAGKAAHAAGRADAERYLSEALDTAGEPVSRAEAAVRLAGVLWPRGRAKEAIALLARACDELPASERERVGRLQLDRLMFEFLAGARTPAEIAVDLRKLLDSAVRGSALRQGTACALLWLEHWAEHPRPDLIDELAGELTDLQPLIDSYGSAFIPFQYGISALGHTDHFELAHSAINAAVAAAQESGNLIDYMAASVGRAVLIGRAGALAEAEADARGALQLARLADHRAGLIFALAGLVRVLTLRGALDEADLVLSAHGLDRTDEGTPVDNALLYARSELRYHQGRYADARDDIVRGLEFAGGQRHGPLQATAPRVLAAAGELERARALAEESIATARAARFVGILGIALHSAGLTEPGEVGILRLREAVDVLQRSSWRPYCAEALVDLGAALRRSNHRAEAREPLREGMHLGHRLGMQRLAERAREELIATGARPRRLMRRGIDALTASERRVATLAADGLTISEVAQRLFVTRKTVETHLYAAYRKLDVDSRDALAAALHPDERITPARGEPGVAADTGVTQLAVVLLTRVPVSTEAAGVGEREWRELITRHDGSLYDQAAGPDVAMAQPGDKGFLATFTSAVQAVRCAEALRDISRPAGVGIRSGLHAGEITLADHRPHGTTIDVAAGILAAAKPGEVLLSNTVIDLAAPAGLSVEDRGLQQFPGVPTRWRVFAALSARPEEELNPL